jgi:aminoglycoside 6'-N-acetyltransferase
VSIILRPATEADLALMKRWDRNDHTPPDPDEGWNWEVELGVPSPGRRQIIAELNGRPLGFMQLLDLGLDVSGYWQHLDNPAGHASIDIWIGELEDLNKGHGREMMRQAIELVFSDPAIHTILIDPQIENEGAIRFYQRLGFHFIEEREIWDEDVLIHALTRVTYNLGTTP